MGQIWESQISFSFEKKMALNAFEDFLQLGMNYLENDLSVRGLNITRRKTELVARAFAAFEMKLPVIVSSKEQQKKLNLNYTNRLQTFKIHDPLSTKLSKRTDNIL